MQAARDAAAAARGRRHAIAPTRLGTARAGEGRPHVVQVTFAKQRVAIDETPRLPFLRPYPAGVNIAETRTGAYLRSVEIAGPFDPTGPGNSPSRQRILDLHAGQPRRVKTPCATPDPDLARAPRVSPAGHGGRRRAAARVLSRRSRRGKLRRRESSARSAGCSSAPSSCFASNATRRRRRPERAYRISDVELASRLSFFLWSSIPDDELLTLAEQKRLNDPPCSSGRCAG